MNHTLGIIGFGGMASGYHYATTCREDVPFTTTAVFDLRESQRALAKEKGLAVFDNLQDFLASHLFEMVLVATPNNMHCPMACAAMEAGYHVMVEKPVAMSSAEVETMIETSKRTGKLFTVHHNRRWDRDFLIVKQAFADGLVGKPFTIESRIHGNLRDDGQGGLHGWRAFEDHGGGMLLDWGVHMLDQLLFLIDEPLVSVSANILSHRGRPVDDYSKVILTFASGLCAQMEVTTFTPLKLPRWYIVGEEGALTMDAIDAPHAVVRHVDKSHMLRGNVFAYNMTEVSERPDESFIVDKSTTFEYPSADRMPPQDWASLYKNLGGVLDGTEELVVKPEQVLRCFRVIEAAFTSAREHRTILFNE